MRVEIVADYEAMSDRAAEILGARIRSRPDAVLGFATGHTPTGLYRRLVDGHRAGELDLSRITAFLLDEYLGLGPNHPSACARYMRTQLFEPVGLPPDRVRALAGRPADPEAECLRYEAEIEGSGGIDLQILGIGTNGHLGFNEPGSSLGSRTRVAALARETLRRDARRFEGPGSPPTHGVTMGLGTIGEARELLLLASGETKTEAIRAALEGPVTAMVPASILQLHPAARVLVDEAAASGLAYRHRDGLAEPP